jgi:hypothetical protein
MQDTLDATRSTLHFSVVHVHCFTLLVGSLQSFFAFDCMHCQLLVRVQLMPASLTNMGS